MCTIRTQVVALLAALVSLTGSAQPTLDVAYDDLAGSVLVSWSGNETGYQLEYASGVGGEANWRPLNATLFNGRFVVELPAAESPRYFRLSSVGGTARLSITATSDGLAQLDWRSDAASWVLESSDRLAPGATWSRASEPLSTQGVHARLSAIPVEPERYFRLRQVLTPASSENGPRLEMARINDGQLQLAWEDNPPGLVLEVADALASAIDWRPVTQAPLVQGTRRILTLTPSAALQFYRLRQGSGTGTPELSVIAESSPTTGESGVAVTRETILRFSGPLAPDTVIGPSTLFAEFGGRRLLARPQLSSDRRTATLFYLENLPAGARVRVTFRGNDVSDAGGKKVDADGDGQPGGVKVLEFDTAGVGGLPGTAVVGRVYASEKNADGSNRPLANVTITVDGAEERLRTTTDESGAFTLQPAPAGRFFVHVDGRTAVGSQWPTGAYYPYVGKAWETVPGKTNNLAGGSGEVFLPLIQSDALRAVSETEATKITFSPSVLAANPALAGVEIDVPANALFSDNGTRGGKVGMAPVPPDRLPEPLPPGLNLPLVITIQTDGPANFDRPVPVRFPNLPDPVTGEKLPPGAKTVLWSFNHDTGRWEAQGTATISADGQFAITDPGVGVRQPGWHGVNPGSPPQPDEPDPPPKPEPPFPDPPEDDPCKGQVGHYDCDNDGCAESDDPCEDECEKKKKEKERIEKYCPMSTPFKNVIEDFFSCPFLGDCPDPQWRKKFLQCREQLADALADYHICISKSGGALAAMARRGQIRLQALAQHGAEQRQLVEAAARPFDLLFGSPEFTAIEPQDTELATGVLAAMSRAFQAGSLGGVTITPEERSGIHGLPLPINLTPALVDTAISRLNAYHDGSMPAAERQAIDDANTAYHALWQQFQSRGWRTPFDGFHGIDAEFSQAAKADAHETFFPRRQLFYRIVNLENGFEFRGRLNRLGRFEGVVLPPTTYLRIDYLDPVTLACGHAVFRSAATGGGTAIPAAIMERSEALTDSDADGLADAGELIVGTNPAVPDTDGDGLNDATEILQSLNPLDGQAASLGPVAALATPGQATEIAVGEDLAAIADGPAGVILVNVADPLRPRLLNRISLRGSAVYAAVDGRYLAVAQGPAGVALIDIANPAQPVVLWDQEIRGTGLTSISAVALRGGTVFAGSENAELIAVDAASGRVRQVLPTNYVFSNGRTDDMQLVGDTLYLLSKQENDVLNAGILAIFRLDGDFVLPVETVVASGGAAELGSQVRRHFFAGGGLAYVGYFGGHMVVNVAGPTNQVIARPTRNLLSVYDLAANGAGLLLQAATFGNLRDYVLAAYDVRNPLVVSNFLGSYPLINKPKAMTLHRGRALVVGGDAGLTVVNYLGPDSAGKAPALAPRLTMFPGDVTVEGVRWRVDANATDDVQVRDVEVFLGATRVGFDGSFPFEVWFRAPVSSPAGSVRVKATDMSGNSSFVDVPLSDATPPHIVKVEPAVDSIVPEDVVDEVLVTFDEPLAAASVAAKTIALMGPGADRRLNTADDQPVEILQTTLLPDQRTVVAKLAAPLASAEYRVTLAPGLTDAAGNARAVATPWQFKVTSGELMVLEVQPERQLVVVDGVLPTIRVQFRSSVPPDAVASITNRFTSAGPDGRLRTGDDIELGTVVGKLVAPNTLEITPPQPLGAGSYLLRISSPLMSGSALNPVQQQFDLRTTANTWKAPGNGNWSQPQNWSAGAVWPNDSLIIPGPVDRTTTNDMAASIANLTSDATLVLQRSLDVSGLADLHAPLVFADADVSLGGGGTVRAHAGVTINSSIFQNRSTGLGDVTLINEEFARWLSGNIRVTTPNSRWINQPEATFEVSEAALDIRQDTFGNQPGGRFLNFGLVRKPAGTNSVQFRGMRMQNDGRVEVSRGSLAFLDYEGAGEVMVAAGGSARFFGTARINDGSRITGAGDIDLGLVSGANYFPVDARIDGDYRVGGTTRLLTGNANFLAAVDTPTGVFESYASLNETLRFSARVRLGQLFGRGGTIRFDAPAELDTLTMFGSVIAGPGTLRVNHELGMGNSGGFGAGGDVDLHGIARMTNATFKLSGRTLHIRETAEFQAEGGGFDFDGTRGRLLNSGTLRQTGDGTFLCAVLLENRGVIEVAGGQFYLRFGTTAEPLGDWVQSASGDFRLAGGGLTTDRQTFTHRSGILGGVGEITKPGRGLGTLTNESVLRVGSPEGTLTLNGFNFVQTSTGELRVGLGPDGAGKLEVAGQGARATIGGALRIELAAGFSPNLGQRYDIVTSASRTGEFAKVQVPDLGPGKRLVVGYSATQVTLTVSP